MMYYRLTVLVHCILLMMTSYVLAQPKHLCQGTDPCKCTFQDTGAVVDITSLGNNDGTPRFNDVISEDGYLYSYNPCKPFQEGICKNAAVCKKDKNTGEALMAGSADMPQFTYDQQTGDTVVGYTAGELGQIHTFVYLMCDPSRHPGPAQFFPNGTVEMNVFILTVFSACACGDRCDENGIIGDTSELLLGPGAIIIIGLAALLVVYCSVGSIYNKFNKNASGREIIPNSAFWCGLPGNIKNGVVFTLSKCRRK